MSERVLGSMAFNCFFLSCGRKCQQLLIGWRDGRREGEGGEEDREGTKEEERQCGRREGNVTRQGGDMEHRITVYRVNGGGVCVNVHVCVCVGGWGYVTGCLIWMLLHIHSALLSGV